MTNKEQVSTMFDEEALKLIKISVKNYLGKSIDIKIIDHIITWIEEHGYLKNEFWNFHP